jgi:type IV pilus assembly protein PilC
MATFVYKAMDGYGKQIEDRLVANDRAAAIEELCGKALTPISIERVDDTQSAGLFAKSGRVSKREVDEFTRQLSNLLSAGVPMSRALGILSREAAKPATKKLWATVHDTVSGGMALADALGQHPRAFSNIYVAMVRAGETGGFLDIVLNQIATFRAREEDLKGRVKAALVYPVVLAVLASLIVIFLLTYFIPQFSQMFADYGGTLPPLTQAIVGASHALKTYWIIFALLGGVIVFGLHRMKTTEEGRRAMDRGLLSMPVLGTGMSRFALVRFCRMLGTLIGAGVPLIGALKVAKEAIGHQVLADTVSGSIENVQKGNPLAHSLQECRILFPPAVIEMISVAEESGRLDKELTRLATAYEDELDRHLKMMVSLIEPLLLFAMAAIVGTVVIGMLLPIFSLQQLIK